MAPSNKAHFKAQLNVLHEDVIFPIGPLSPGSNMVAFE